MYVRIAIRGAFPCSSSQSDVFANIKINFNINLILNILLNINFFNISKTVTYEKKGLFSFFKKK